jgi:hypothetical protein
MKRRNRVLLAVAGLLVVAGTAIAVLDLRVAAERKSVETIRREVEESLPIGASEAEVVQYISDRGLAHGEVTFDPNDSFVESGVPSGEPVIVTSYLDDGGIVLVPSREISMFFALDAERDLKRVVVVERLQEPCWTC